MTSKNVAVGVIVVLAVAVVGYFFFSNIPPLTTVVEDSTGAPQGKLDINAVCEGALAYMTFPDGASADAFVSECKEGKHPEVIEQYKAQMDLGDGAAI